MNDVSPQGSSPAVALLQAIGGHAGRRTRRALTALAIGQTAAAAWRSAVSKTRAERQFVIAVPGDDAIYADVHAWVLDNLPPARRHAMIVRSGRSNDSIPASDGPDRPRLRLFFDGRHGQTVLIDGHPVHVQVEKPDWSTNRPEEQTWKSALERVTFTAANMAGRDAVLNWLAKINADQTRRRPRLRIAGKWGGWTSNSELATRSLDTVVLRAGQLEHITGDLDSFLRTEGDYARLGLPWHRGYLFHGQPGTGKTSTALALAAHFRLDVYYVTLGSLDNDQALIEALAAVQPRSMLLLEDIDVVHGAKTRDDTAGGVSLAGLLNALDGAVTPHGLVTVMTTNNRDLLDPALLRPGRIDVETELLPCDDAQIERMCEQILGPTLHHFPKLNGRVVTPAQIVGVFKDHLDNPPAAVAALDNWLWRQPQKGVA